MQKTDFDWRDELMELVVDLIGDEVAPARFGRKGEGLLGPHWGAGHDEGVRGLCSESRSRSRSCWSFCGQTVMVHKYVTIHVMLGNST